MNMEIANRLIELRKANNLSQEALAEKLGISRQTVSEWECAEISPDTEHLIMLAKLYQISVDDLLKTNEEIIPVKNHSFMQESSTDLPLGLLAVIAYLALGCLYHLWHPGWLVFLLVPIISSAISAIRKKRADCFSYSALVLFVFLYAGCVKTLWHPTWLLFLTIPLYYKILELFGGKSDRQKQEKI